MKAEDFFKYYKKEKDKKEQMAIMENYARISDDFKMDCTPIPISELEVNKK